MDARIGVSIDTDANAAYLALADRTVKKSIDHGPFILDFDHQGRLVGVEVLNLRNPPPASAVMDAVDSTHRNTVASFIREVHAADSPRIAPTMSDSIASIDDQDFLTVAEVAGLMGVSRMTVYRMVRAGSLPALKIGRSYRIPESAVNEWINNLVIDLTAT